MLFYYYLVWIKHFKVCIHSSFGHIWRHIQVVSILSLCYSKKTVVFIFTIRTGWKLQKDYRYSVNIIFNIYILYCIVSKFGLGEGGYWIWPPYRYVDTQLVCMHVRVHVMRILHNIECAPPQNIFKKYVFF